MRNNGMAGSYPLPAIIAIISGAKTPDRIIVGNAKAKRIEND